MNIMTVHYILLPYITEYVSMYHTLLKLDTNDLEKNNKRGAHEQAH